MNIPTIVRFADTLDVENHNSILEENVRRTNNLDIVPSTILKKQNASRNLKTTLLTSKMLKSQQRNSATVDLKNCRSKLSRSRRRMVTLDVLVQALHTVNNNDNSFTKPQTRSSDSFTTATENISITSLSQNNDCIDQCSNQFIMLEKPKRQPSGNIATQKCSVSTEKDEVSNINHGQNFGCSESRFDHMLSDRAQRMPKRLASRKCLRTKLRRSIPARLPPRRKLSGRDTPRLPPRRKESGRVILRPPQRQGSKIEI